MKERTFEIYANGQFLALVTEQLLRQTMDMINSMINYQGDIYIRVKEVDYVGSQCSEDEITEEKGCTEGE